MATLLAAANKLIKDKEEADLASSSFVLPDDIRELTGYTPRPQQVLMRQAERRFNVQVLHRRFGKALALDTPVPKADGSWSTMGALQEGDRILGADGRPVTVLGAHPVQLGRPCYRVRFSCGEEVIADEDHLWATTTKADRTRYSDAGRGRRRLPSRPPRARATREIAETLRSRGENNHRVAIAGPAQFEGQTQPLLLDPYLLGVWLGDGTSRVGQVTTMDRDLIPPGAYPTKWQNAGRAKTYVVPGLETRLRVLGVLGNKRIPEEYLRASYLDRLELLRGLMDTDGHINKAGTACELCLTKRDLLEDAMRLVRSLGMVAGDGGHRITFTPRQQPFNLARKHARWHPPKNNHRFIVACDPVPSVPVRCITVDAEDKLFLVGRNYVPTHNTVDKINKLIERAVECPFPNGRYAYLAPTYSQAADIAWMYLLEFTEKLPGRKIHQTRLYVEFANRCGSRSRITLYGVDSPKQRLRGLYLDGCVIDEAAQCPWSVWTDQVRPMLMDENRRGIDQSGFVNQWADFIFTPAGRNHMYTLYMRAQRWMAGLGAELDLGDGKKEIVKSDQWSAYRMKASETGILPEDELREALIAMGRDKYDQEMETSFEAAVQGAIYGTEIGFLRRKERFKTYPFIPELPVHTAWDLGRDDATAIWFFQVRSFQDVRLVRYYENNQNALPFYADELVRFQEEHGWYYGYHLLPHDVEVTDLSVDKNRAGILRQAGVHVSTVPKHHPPDGIAAVQALLPYCRFDDELCGRGIDCLSLYRRRFNELLGTYGEPVHDEWSHGADAFRTLAMGLRSPSSASGLGSSLVAAGQFNPGGC